MTYLIIGKDELVNEEIKSIIKNNNIDNTAISKYNLKDDSILDAIDDINTYSLFSTKKLIIVYNIKDLVIDEDRDESKELIKYLDNQNDNILVLCGSSNVSKRSVSTILNKKCNKIDASCFNIDNYIKELLGDFKMSFFTISKLKSYCSNDVVRLKNEILKLKMFKFDEKEILDDDIELLVSKDLDKTIFDLINAIESDNKRVAFDIYKLLKDNNEEDMKIFSMIVNNYRLIYKVKLLSDNYNDDQINKMLGFNNLKRVYVLKKKGNDFTFDELRRKISSLAEFDYNIKNGIMDVETSLKLFIAK